MINKSIALFHSEFAYSGGAERLVFEHYKFFDQKGLKPCIYTAFIDKRSCFPKEIGNYRIKCLVPEVFSKIFPHEFLLILSMFFLPFYAHEIKKYDFIFAENQAGPWWAYFFFKVFGIKYATFQNYPTTVTYPRKIDYQAKRNVWYVQLIIELVKPLMVYIDKLAIKNALIAFANGEYVSIVCKKAYGRRFVSAPGGSIRGEFNKKIFANRYKDPYVLIVNRHFPAKKIEVGILSASKYPFKLIIAGSHTSYTDKLIKLVKDLGLGSRVKFIGLIEGKKWIDTFKNACVYLYTAPEEDYGLGNVEAFNFGLPVVAWNNAGPSYIIKSGYNGYLVDLDDVDAFSESVWKIVSNKKLNLKLSQNAYKSGQSYTWEKHNQIIWTTLKKHILS